MVEGAIICEEGGKLISWRIQEPGDFGPADELEVLN